jgi:hypothetical protein
VTAVETKRRRGVANRRDHSLVADRRHRAKISAVPARGINKEDGLAEKSSARCEVIAGMSTKETEHYYVSRAAGWS